MKKTKKKWGILLIVIVILAILAFFGWKFLEKKKDAENYKETIEAYLFYEEDEIVSEKPKQKVEIEDYDKKYFMFSEAAESLERLYNGKNFLFVDAKKVKRDARSFEKFLTEDLNLEIASSVSKIDEINQLKSGEYEILTTNYYYSKYNDDKVLTMKFATIVDEKNRKIKSSKGYVVNLITKDDKGELVTLRQKEVRKHIKKIEKELEEIENKRLAEEKTKKRIEEEAKLKEELEQKKQKQLELEAMEKAKLETVEKGDTSQEKDIEEFTEYINK